MNKGKDYNTAKVKYLFKFCFQWRSLVLIGIWDFDFVPELAKWAPINLIFKVWELKFKGIKGVAPSPKPRMPKHEVWIQDQGSSYCASWILSSDLLYKGTMVQNLLLTH